MNGPDTRPRHWLNKAIWVISGTIVAYWVSLLIFPAIYYALRDALGGSDLRLVVLFLSLGAFDFIAGIIALGKRARGMKIAGIVGILVGLFSTLYGLFWFAAFAGLFG